MSAPRQTFVVIVREGEYTCTVAGPYRTFKRAEGDAKAWQKRGREITVEPITKIIDVALSM